MTTNILDLVAAREAEKRGNPRRGGQVVAVPASGDLHPYVRRALAAETTAIMDTGEGGRNHQLNTSAFNLGQLVGGGVLEHDEAVAALTDAARAAGLDESEIGPTVRSGLEAGVRTPRGVPVREVPDVDPAVLLALHHLNEAAQVVDVRDEPPPEDDDVDPVPPSWAPQDLSAIVNGTFVRPAPELLPRSDGQYLLYPGKVHSLHGESESGKSWVAQYEAARLVMQDRPVLYVDFEDDAAGVAGRLLDLGVPGEQLLAHFTYIRPESSPATAHELAAWHAMLGGTFDYAVVDGVTDAMGIFGKESSSNNDEVSSFLRTFPKQLARRTGAAVVLIDHVTKDKETRGRFAIGGQAKMAGLDGAAYVVDVVSPLGKGMRGELTIRVAKDRPGGVRGACGPPRKSDRTQEAARFILDSTSGSPRAELAVPVYTPDGERSDGATEFRPTHLMEKVSQFCQTQPSWLSKNTIESSVSGNNDAKRTAIDLLHREGYLKAEPNGRGGALRYLHLRPYTKANDGLLDDADSDRAAGWV